MLDVVDDRFTAGNHTAEGGKGFAERAHDKVDFINKVEMRRRSVATMAYCPIDQGALASDPTFAEIGRRLGVSAAQAALAWVLRQPDVIAIPKAGRETHLRENLAAAAIELTDRDLAAVDARFAPPRRKRRLAMS